MIAHYIVREIVSGAPDSSIPEFIIYLLLLPVTPIKTYLHRIVYISVIAPSSQTYYVRTKFYYSYKLFC